VISKKVIKKYGLDAASLKKIFTADKRDKRVVALNDLLRDRIVEGRTRNLTDYKIWAAVDIAYDAPLNQITPTLCRNIIETGGSQASIMKAMKAWNIENEVLFSPMPATESGEKRWALNEPVFNKILIPFVRSYLTIRLAKIYNDRNLSPLFEYSPRIFTSENRVICQIVTEIVESISTEFGYSAILRDFIFNALMYSVSIMFPVESWTKDVQEGDDGDEVVEREGVRYVVPHVTRTFYDLTYPLHTLNTGTGCSYAGYWTIMRWGDVASDKSYWNRDNVPHGTNWMDKSNVGYFNYFQEVYPCSLSFPTSTRANRNDRESMIARYTKNDFDSAFFVTYVFMELVPADWGLGKYPNKVWMKFTMGGDDTIMFAEVWTYRPMSYIGYDADSGRGRNASLALEILPFQDLSGNIFSNFILSIKRNLANIIFYNTDVVDESDITNINKRNNAQYTQLNFLGFSGIKMERQAIGGTNALFQELKFPFVDTNQILSGLTTTIAMLERLLVVAPQEIGASASHQQSKKEVEITSANTTNRVAYTASFVDEGIDALKRQIWEAVKTNMSGKEVVATIPYDIPNLEDNLKKLGFTIVESQMPDHPKVVVKGKIDKLNILQLVARRSDADRQTDAQTATAMLTALGQLSTNQYLSQIIDPASLVKLYETAAKFMGADDDFEVRLNKNAVMGNQLMQSIEEIKKQLLDVVNKQVAQPAAQAIAGVEKKVEENAAAVQQLVGILEKLQQQAQPQPPPQPALPPTFPTQGQPTIQ